MNSVRNSDIIGILSILFRNQQLTRSSVRARRKQHVHEIFAVHVTASVIKYYGIIRMIFRDADDDGFLFSP